MPKKISIFFHIFVVFLLFYSYSQAEEIKILPLKKPLLTKEIIKKKISKNIIKPKKKPTKKVVVKEVTKDQKIKPQNDVFNAKVEPHWAPQNNKHRKKCLPKVHFLPLPKNVSNSTDF